MYLPHLLLFSQFEINRHYSRQKDSAGPLPHGRGSVSSGKHAPSYADFVECHRTVLQFAHHLRAEDLRFFRHASTPELFNNFTVRGIVKAHKRAVTQHERELASIGPHVTSGVQRRGLPARLLPTRILNLATIAHTKITGLWHVAPHRGVGLGRFRAASRPACVDIR